MFEIANSGAPQGLPTQVLYLQLGLQWNGVKKGGAAHCSQPNGSRIMFTAHIIEFHEVLGFWDF
jgi:hypothetical protein